MSKYDAKLCFSLYDLQKAVLELTPDRRIVEVVWQAGGQGITGIQTSDSYLLITERDEQLTKE